MGGWDETSAGGDTEDECTKIFMNHFRAVAYIKCLVEKEAKV